MRAFNKRELLTLEETLVDRGLRFRQPLDELRNTFGDYFGDSDVELKGKSSEDSADETE